MRSAVLLLAAATLVHSQVDLCQLFETFELSLYVPHQHDCSQFWVCQVGPDIPGQCPPGKHFSPSTSTCEDPATAGCVAMPAPQETCHYNCSCSATQDMATCPTRLEFPTQLDVFRCANTSTCNVGHENIALSSERMGRLSTRSAVARTRLCPKNRPPSRRSSIYRHFADCSKKVRCAGTNEWVEDCDPGLLYNSELDLCVYPGRAGVDCSSNPALPGGCPTTRPLYSCPYTCGCSVTLGKCPVQLHYDAIINITDSNTHPDCRADSSLIALDSRFYGSMYVETSSAMFNHCPAGNLSVIQYMPDLLHCGTVHRCVEGEAATLTCPTGSQFDTRTNTCVPNLAATCQDPPQPTLPLPPPCPTSATCPAGATRVRHPTDCTLFCECVQGAPYLGACPPGLDFSEQTLACVPPGTANCQTHE